MADKYSYGNMSVPAGESRYSILRWGWGGLNRTDLIDSGDITDCDGVNINPPYVDAASSLSVIASYAEPIGIFGFGEFLLVLYRAGGKIRADYRYPGVVYSGIIGDATGTIRDFVHRTAVQFNVAENVENIVASTYNRKILIFPDRVSLDFKVSANGFTAASLGEGYPSIKYATVYGSRLFGVDENLVYASSYNDYADWDLDTADESLDSNAWVSMSQSNAKADGEFTGIWTYDNHVVLFKKDFTQLVYNNKNPFRIVDVTAYGAENPYAITETEGTLFFASKDMVYAFTGGIPKAVGEELGSVDFTGAAMGSYKDRTYICAGNVLYRFSDGVWSQRTIAAHIKQFATTDAGLYGLTSTGIVLVDSAASGTVIDNSAYGDWWFETDFMAAGRLDVRRAKKMTVLCQIAEGAQVEVYLLRDGETFDPSSSRRVLRSAGHGWRTLCGLIRGMSADMHRVRFVGHGWVRIHALELQISWGGDLYKER